MELADHLLEVLHDEYEEYLDENDMFDGDDEEIEDEDCPTFSEYLKNRGFDLERYHLDNEDKMDERIEKIEDEARKRDEGEAKFKAKRKAELLDHVKTSMLHVLGEAAQESKQRIEFASDSLTNVTLETVAGRNAVYLTLRDKKNNVIAESSYKMSRNSIASRYYDFDKNQFTPWVAVKVNPKWQDFESADKELDTHHFLRDHMKDNYTAVIRDFTAGYFGTFAKDENEDDDDEKPARANNQDWDSMPDASASVLGVDDDCGCDDEE